MANHNAARKTVLLCTFLTLLPLPLSAQQKPRPHRRGSIPFTIQGQEFASLELSWSNSLRGRFTFLLTPGRTHLTWQHGSRVDWTRGEHTSSKPEEKTISLTPQQMAAFRRLIRNVHFSTLRPHHHGSRKPDATVDSATLKL